MVYSRGLKSLWNVIVVICVIWLGYLDAQTISWSKIRGPYSGSIQLLMADQMGHVFCTSFFGRVGIYRSTDRGGSWQQVYSVLSYGYESALAVDSSKNIYYGDIDVGLYESSDGGTSWYKNSLAGGASAIAAISGSRICVGGYKNVSISNDAGKTWTTSQVMTDRAEVLSIAEDSSGNIYAGFKAYILRPPAQSYGGGVYISSDSGKIWKLYGMRLVTISSIVARERKVFILAGNIVFSAPPMDSNWTQDAAGIPQSANIVALQSDPLGEIVAVTDQGIFVYSDSTDSWKFAAPTVSSATITTAFYSPNDISYTGTAWDGVFILNSTSANWLQCGIFPASITALGTDNAGSLYVGTDDGIYKPGPTAGTWIRASNGLSRGTVNNLYLSRFTGRLYASTSDGLFYLLKGLSQWNPAFGGLAYDFAESPTYAYIGTTGGILESYGGQDIWTSIQTIGLPLNNIYSIALDSSNNLFAGTKFDGVFKSTDGGSFWTETGVTSSATSPLIFCSVKTIKINNTGRIFAGTDTSGAFYSDDSGTSWYNIPSISGKNVTCFLVNQASKYFAGTLDRGVFISTDRGLSWKPVNNSLTDSSVTSLIFDQYGNLYAGTDSGLFRGTIITSINQPNDEPLSFSLSQNYPNPFNPTTTIDYRLPKNGFVTLKVYDILGREVATLVNENQDAGIHSAVFDGTRFANGVYFYRLTASGHSQVKKMILTK